MSAPENPGRLAGQEVHVHVVVELQRLQVHHEHLLALVQVGQVHVYLTVEAACAQQGRVEHVGAVGGGQRDDAAVGAEAVHLGEQGVQRVLALVVAAHGGVLRAGTAHGVYLVDEDDARRLRLGLLEQVAHTAGTHADEHLDEVGARHREERHAGLAGHGLGQQRLARSRRTYEQGALGNLAAQLGVFLRVLQEVHNLLHLLLGTGLSGHVLERDAQVAALLVHLGLRLAYAEDAAAAHAGTAAAHAPHEQHPQAEDEHEGQQVVEEHLQHAALLAVVIGELAHEQAVLARLVDELLHLGHAAYLHVDVGLLAPSCRHLA